ncbi:MAG: methyltransferase [Anaerolineae bacterium]|nr:methyltransferase [Anaerolineae bacterium]
MTSRERVLAAIDHREADRVPVDLGGMRSTGIMAMAYASLKRHLGISEGGIYVYDPGQQLALVEKPVLERYGADVVPLDLGTLKGWQPWVLPDGTQAQLVADFILEPDGEGGWYQVSGGRRVSHKPAASYYFDTIYHPLAEAQSVADVEGYELAEMPDEDLRLLEAEARRLRSETEYAIMGAFGGAFLEGGQGLRGWDQFLVDLAVDRPLAVAILDRILERNLHNVRRYLDSVGSYIDLIQVGGDLGTQAGPQIRPEWYYELIQPRQKAFWSEIHRLSDCKVFLHSCGSIRDLIDGIIDAGCDVLNPVQTSARGMDAAELKAEFGDRITFWGGGCDTQSVLPFGTPEQVYEHVKERLEILKPGGGFVFCQIHNIQAGTPPENIEAMYQAVRDNWRYEGAR